MSCPEFPRRPVLVVDDDPSVRDAVATLLRLEGYTVRTAEHGQQALTMLRSGLQPSLIVLDLKMPVMDGVNFIREQSTDPELAGIPVVIYSAVADSTSRQTLRGVRGIVTKQASPAEIDRLLELVATHCLRDDPGSIGA